MASRRVAIALAVVALMFVCSAPDALSDPLWQYDGTAYAKTQFDPHDTTPGDQENKFGYSGFTAIANAGFATARAEGGNFALKAFSLGNGKVSVQNEWHVSMSSARANALIKDLLPGTYLINFDYTTTDTMDTPLLGTWPKVGFETVAGSQELTGSGHFTSVIDVTIDFYGYWIAFFASSQTNAIEGLAESTATVSNITVAPVSLLPVAAPIPGALWLFAPGLAGLIGLKRRYRG